MQQYYRNGIRLLLTVFTFGAVSATATVRNVPGTYATIQQAIDASVSGDTVLVAPGTYSGDVSFSGKSIRLFSSGGANATTLNVTANLLALGQAGVESEIDGFTFQIFNPSTNAIFVPQYSSPIIRIENNRFFGNANSQGAVAVNAGTVTFQFNLVANLFSVVRSTMYFGRQP